VWPAICIVLLSDDGRIAIMGRGAGKMESLRESVKYTYADFEHFPDDGKRREIIDGELYVTPSPATSHQIVVGNLYFLIRRYLEDHRVGRIFLAPLDVVFSQFDVVEPDLLFVSTGRAGVVTRKNIAGSPDLAIEVLSPGPRRTDETIKRRLYERFDVLEYWIVDPRIKAMKIHRRAVAGVPFEHAIAAADRVNSSILPDLTIELSTVFEGL
jgi:Uma2 family endonuclease